MLSFLIYEGKVAIVLAVFSLFYRLLLKRESFHRLNRVVLVGMMLVSFLLPMCIITIHKPMEMASQQIQEEVSSIAGIAGTASGAWWPMALSILFFVGVVFALARELVSILSVLRIIRQGECVQEEDGCKIVVTNRDVGPFSWMKYIVLSRQDWASPHESIITHEKAHIITIESAMYSSVQRFQILFLEIHHKIVRSIVHKPHETFCVVNYHLTVAPSNHRSKKTTYFYVLLA